MVYHGREGVMEGFGMAPLKPEGGGYVTDPGHPDWDGGWAGLETWWGPEGPSEAQDAVLKLRPGKLSTRLRWQRWLSERVEASVANPK